MIQAAAMPMTPMMAKVTIFLASSTALGLSAFMIILAPPTMIMRTAIMVITGAMMPSRFWRRHLRPTMVATSPSGPATHLGSMAAHSWAWAVKLSLMWKL